MKRFTALLLLGALASFGFVACGDDDGSGDATDNVLRVTEDDYSFDIDDSVKAGTVTLDVENVGDELHMFGACALKDGKTEADVQTALKADDESALGQVCEDESMIDSLGGGLTPGGTLQVTANDLEAGNYVAICFLPDKDGKPHFAHGMVKGFTIGEGDESDAPEADVTYTATKDKLSGPKRLDAGETTIQLDVEKGAPDEMVLVKIKDGKTSDDVDAYFKKLDEDGFYDKADSPVDLLYFAFDSTDTRWFTADLTPGTWAIGVQDSDAEDTDIPADEDPHVVLINVS